MIQSLLQLLARLTCRQPWLVITVSTIAAVASVVYTVFELELNADLDALIARDQPFMAEYQRFLDEFGDLEYLFVVVAGEDVAKREAAVDYLGEHLSPLDGVPSINYVIEPHEQLRIATRAMPEPELNELTKSAGAFEALQAGPAVAVLYATDQLDRLMRSNDEVEQEQLAASAFLIAEAITNDELIPTPQREYLVSPTGKLHFLQIEPVRDFGTLAVIQEPLRQIRGVLDEARREFPDVEIGLTGKPVLQADEMETSDRDMTRAAIAAVILVSILFMIVIGGIWHPALAVVSLLFGIAWTFGATTLFIGQLTLLSIVFTLVLVGVGIDFGVHFVSRYKEQRRGDDPNHNSIEAAITTALLTAGRGNITGAITSSMAFFMAIFTQFQGLRELGLIAGFGLLLCLLAMLLVLPSLIVVFDRARARKGAKPPVLPDRTKLQRSVWNVLMARPGTFLAIIIGVSLLMSPMLMRLDFEKNLLELQAPDLPSVQWEHRILEDSGESFFGAVIVDSKQEVLEVIQRAQSQEAVARAGSIFDVIQPPSKTRDALRERLHRTTEIDVDDTPEQLTAAHLAALRDRMNTVVTGARMQELEEADELAELRDRVQELHVQLSDDATAETAREQIEQRIATAADVIDIMLAGDLMPLRDAMPRAVRSMFISEHGRFLVALYPVENVWEFEPMERFVAAMREIDPDATGVPITQYESLIEMLRAFITAASLAFVAVFLLLWLDLRRVGDAVLAMVPLIVGMLWLLQLMALFDVSFNHANFFAVPILIGIGVDSGIHLMRRYRERHPDDIAAGRHDAEDRSTFGSTRRAVFMTSMTSLIGFGCLATASHQGLQSLGLVMALGAGSLMIASLFVLPILLAVLERRQG